ncbi:MAG TPA: hypothetical protein VF852_18740 [Pseudolabrys sp.]
MHWLVYRQVGRWLGSSGIKHHQSLATLSRVLTLLAIVAFGVATGVLWPMNSFLLRYLGAFVGSLLGTLIIAGLVWCAITLYVLVYYPLIKLFRFKTKKTFVLPVTHHDVTPVSVRRPAQDRMIAQEWISVAMLIVVATLWLLLVRWAITASPNSIIAFSGWGALACATAASGLSVIAGAYDNDDVGTFSVVAAIAGALFTTFVLVGLFELL